MHAPSSKRHTTQARLVGLCLISIPSFAGGQSACAAPPAGAGTRFYIEPVTAGPRDTTVAARLCLAPGAKGIGSYMAVITYDSTKARAQRVDVSGGMQVANSRVAGSIRLAGAAPAGFAKGQLALIVFRPAGEKAPGKLTLLITEASTPSGASLLSETTARSWPATAAGTPRPGKPVVDSIAPRTGEVSPERVTDLVLYGRGFAPAGNVVLFDGAEVTGLASEAGGSVIRFAAPTWIPARGRAAAHRVVSGPIDVRVRHAAGVSNAVVFIAREDDK